VTTCNKVVSLGSALGNDLGDSASRTFGLLMLPHSYDKPSRLPQQPHCFSVSCDVALDLLAPKLGVRGRRPKVFRAAVPKATVNEDGNFNRPEHNVRAAVEVGKGTAVHPISKASTMDKAPQFQLWLGVS
jgi:hypothetical protein